MKNRFDFAVSISSVLLVIAIKVVLETRIYLKNIANPHLPNIQGHVIPPSTRAVFAIQLLRMLSGLGVVKKTFLPMLVLIPQYQHVVVVLVSVQYVNE